MIELLTQLEPDRSVPKQIKAPTVPEETANTEVLAPLTQQTLRALEQKHLTHQTDEISVFFFQGAEFPEMLQLIGRGRAKTFHAIGAGSGSNIDLSPEDQYYHHLVLWHRSSHQLTGAYRIGILSEIFEQYGADGVYLDHLFEIDPTFYKKLGSSLELSRSFILPEFQKSPRMLDLLWKGLGIVANQLNINSMFGSVTISDSFSPLSQAIIVNTLDTLHSASPELRALITAKYPFQPSTTTHSLATEAFATSGIGSLNKLILELEGQQRTIPPLIRYYLALGAKFLSFQTEPSFNNAIYCLLKVDLEKVPPRYKKRFLG